MSESLLFFLLYGWPEAIVLLSFGLIIIKKPLDYKQILPLGFFLSAIAYTLRQFFVFGVHTIVGILAYSLVFYLFYKVNYIKSLTVSLIITLILGLLEVVSGLILSQFMVLDFSDMNLIKRLGLTWINILLYTAIILLYRRFAANE